MCTGIGVNHIILNVEHEITVEMHSQQLMQKGGQQWRGREEFSSTKGHGSALADVVVLNNLSSFILNLSFYLQLKCVI